MAVKKTNKKTLFILNRKSSVVIAADESTISWGPSPTFGELVSHAFIISLYYNSFQKSSTKC